MLLTNYDEDYDKEIERLDREMFSEIKSHKDVIWDSVCVGLNNGVFAGVGLIMASPALSVLLSESRKNEAKDVQDEGTQKTTGKQALKRYYVNGEYKAVPGTENEVGISKYILDDLKESTRILKKKQGNIELSLRVFCRGTDYAYMEFLIYNGFAARGVMPIFSKKLSKSKKNKNSFEDEPLKKTDEGDSVNGFGVQSLKENKDLYEEYLKSYKAAFKSIQSRHELDFRLKDKNSDIICLTKDSKVVAAISLRKHSKDTVIMENLFCLKKYRKKGLASGLINYLEEKMTDKGIKNLELTVEGDNTPAVALYMKNRYDITGTALIMEYDA